MGLAERRSQKKFEEGSFVELKKEINNIIGSEIEFDVKWETIALVDDWSHLFDEAWTNQYFKTLIGALNEIAIDEMGKEALQESLKKVVIQNTKGNYIAQNLASFKDNTLTLDHEPFTNIPDPGFQGKGDIRYEERVDAIVDVLEKNL